LVSDVDLATRERPGSPEVHVRLTFTIRTQYPERTNVRREPLHRKEVIQTMSKNDTKYNGGSNVGTNPGSAVPQARVPEVTPEVTPVETGNLSGGEVNNGPAGS